MDTGVADQIATKAGPTNVVPFDLIGPGRKRLGRSIVVVATLGSSAHCIRILYKTEATARFETWRPLVYAYMFWGVASASAR